MTDPVKQVCHTCKHYRKTGTNGSAVHECWRYPPAFVNDAQPKRYAKFVPLDPALVRKITCGEWAADA